MDNETTTENGTALDILTSEEAVTSQQEQVSELIEDARGVTERGVTAAEAAREAAVLQTEETFDRAIERAESGAISTRRSFAQASAFGTSTAQFKLMNDTVNDNLNDLNKRKNAALASADTSLAQEIARLEANELLFRTNANQQFFQNMLGLAGVQQNQQAFDLSQRAQEFSEGQSIGSIALEFGLDVREGETIDSIIGRAQPFASKERKLRLDQMQASLNTQRLQAQEIQTKISNRESLKGMGIDAIAKFAIQTGADPLALVLDHGVDAVKLDTAIVKQKRVLAAEDVALAIAGGDDADIIAEDIKNKYDLTTAQVAGLIQTAGGVRRVIQPTPEQLAQGFTQTLIDIGLGVGQLGRIAQ